MVNGEKFQSRGMIDLDLVPAMPNIELVRDIFIYYDVLIFHVNKSNYHAKTQKHRNTETHTDSDEYSIIAFCKNAKFYNY